MLTTTRLNLSLIWTSRTTFVEDVASLLPLLPLYRPVFKEPVRAVRHRISSIWTERAGVKRPSRQLRGDGLGSGVSYVLKHPPVTY